MSNTFWPGAWGWARRCPDIRRAAEQLGWRPTVGCADGLARTIQYFKDLPPAGREE